jgi:hypothetical protein
MSDRPALPTGRGLGLTLVPLWIAVVVLGMIALVRYSLGPGRSAAAPVAWPAATQAHRVAGRPALVMIAHPRCACTRASIGELATLMARCDGRVSATVLFVRPSRTSADWNDTDLRHSAESIPGVTVLTDSGGHEAALFGAATSGQVVLYGADGRLRFSGGITAGRGHAGDNAGRTTVEQYLLAGRPDRPETPVFGCELFDPRSGAPKEATREWPN